ncbi:MAG: hypothetical protein OEZ39_18485 [Gammaproteobacteria bacterium]|nr:hypothetical protein [Gammaproteobacteria bacterium]MDH5653856.1 hypothetical protein [Gammaproteobacteria bacterium]
MLPSKGKPDLKVAAEVLLPFVVDHLERNQHTDNNHKPMNKKSSTPQSDRDTSATSG